MNAELITLIGTITTAIFVVINSIILYQLNKRSKAFDINIEEVHELNVKMHDRLVEVEDEIKSNKYLSHKTRKRLLYNSSRLMKYDETILNDVNLLINNWTVMFSLNQRGSLSDSELAKTRSEMISLIKKIKRKVDKLHTKKVN